MFRTTFLLFFYIVICLIQNDLKAQNLQEFEKLYDSVYKVLRSEDRSSADTIFSELFKFPNITKNDSLAFKLYEQYAFHFYLKGDYEKSAENLLNATDFAGNMNDSIALLDTENNLAVIFSKLGEFKKAKDIYLKIVKQYDDGDTSEGYAATLSNLGSAYEALKKIDSSNIILNRALKISIDKGYGYIAATNFKTLSKNYMQQGLYDSVISITSTLKSKYWDDMDPKEKDDVIYNNSQANYHLGNYNIALEEINEVFSLMKTMDNDPALIDRLEFKSKVLKKIGNYKNALVAQELAVKLRDSFNSAIRSAKVLEIEEKYQAEKKEKENLQLREESTVKDLKIARKNSYILIGSLGFAAIIILLIVYQLNKFKKKNEQLKISIHRREKLEQELTEVRDNIAKDFHDSLGNKLARITALSDLMIKQQNKKTKEHLVKSLNYIKDDSDLLYKQTKDFMFSLKTNSDYVEEVFTYISDFAEDYLSAFEMDLYVEKKVEQNRKLPYYWNRHLVLIAKEAITNAVKHSKASEVHLKLTYNKNRVEMDIKDNGVGFDSKTVKQKSGLEHIVERSKKLNAVVDIISNKNGTTVALKAQTIEV